MDWNHEMIDDLTNAKELYPQRVATLVQTAHLALF